MKNKKELHDSFGPQVITWSYTEIHTQCYSIKSILMLIWKSPYMFRSIYKPYLENFTFLILIS